MKPELVKILACPVCRGTLKLQVTTEEDGEVVEGTLTCQSCKEAYPIKDTIPNLLPPNLRD
ncbi:MAG: Trm112 family protein [SAR202 cluster bacterium]|nr:Trm112 family protein [SAR202 cluster bacterium]